jgi:hypothetical protein
MSPIRFTAAGGQKWRVIIAYSGSQGSARNRTPWRPVISVKHSRPAAKKRPKSPPKADHPNLATAIAELWNESSAKAGINIALVPEPSAHDDGG